MRFVGISIDTKSKRSGEQFICEQKDLIKRLISAMGADQNA
jgi:hypothetical protein